MQSYKKGNEMTKAQFWSKQITAADLTIYAKFEETGKHWAYQKLVALKKMLITPSVSRKLQKLAELGEKGDIAK